MGLVSSCLKKKTTNDLEHTQFQNIDVECKDLIETNDNSDLGSDEQIGGPIGVSGKRIYGVQVFDSSPESDLRSCSENQNQDNQLSPNEQDPFTGNEPISDSALQK
ncbi:hypothetical protein M0812_26685 [Anaeramoeba flamelloides]|uniref:Uncharacterized protein n=1 Tax=Anaeramoeba flamelloides TaxID=1746091 RepID=A0AAV7YEU1_9EUKA|nr:hypothetical protein M0812_26685 [Anaeramoeba flamelloides]